MVFLKEQDIQEIMKMFEHELSLLIRMDRVQKMEIRKRITDVILPLSAMGIQQPKIFMDIVEDKLHDLIKIFLDGYEFKKKLARKVEKKFKQ
jgi:hypothetical protein